MPVPPIAATKPQREQEEEAADEAGVLEFEILKKRKIVIINYHQLIC